MKQALRFCALLIILMLGIHANVCSQVSGTVFRDYNGNGTQDAGEPGVGGIVANAYNSADALSGSATTAAAGTYTITGVTGAVRVEFVIPANGCLAIRGQDYSALNGATYGTSVRFLTAPATGVNYAINYPAQYTTNTNPQLATSIYSYGNNSDLTPPTGSTQGSGLFPAAVRIPFTNANAAVTSTPANTQITQASNMGAVWGIAYSKQADRLLYSAVLKRHVGLGPNGSGAIYFTNPNTTIGATLLVDLDAIGFPTRATSGSYPYAGGQSATNNIPFTGVIGTNAERGLNGVIPTVYPGNGVAAGQHSYDAAAVAQAGKVSLGGLDISDDGRTVFVINLFDRRLYRIPIANPASFSTITSAAGITSYAVPGAATNGVVRPWAVKYYKGKVYVGLVADASAAATIGGTTTGFYSDLIGYIYEFDVATNTFAGSPLATINFNFPKQLSDVTSLLQSNSATNWASALRYNKWNDNYDNFRQDNTLENEKLNYPQPILSDIEFDDNGNIIVAVMDRMGMQVGYRNYAPSNQGPDGPLGSTLAIGGRSDLANGDILRIAVNPTGCVITPESIINGGGTGTEFFGGDFYNAGNAVGGALKHSETMLGALAFLPGSGRTIATAYDPSNSVNSSGIFTLDNTSGIRFNNGTNFFGANLYNDANRGVTGAKGIGLGDVELLGELSPTEIGNRIWNDVNGNGVQDAGEAAIANVSLELFVDSNNDGVPDGAAIGTTTTNAIGEWYFNDANITGDGDPNIAGTQDRLTAGVRYLIRPAAADWTGGNGTGDLANYRLTGTDVTGNGAVDLSDNDAAFFGSGASRVPQISVLIAGDGANNHDLDFGFTQLGAIGDKVWLDNGTGGGTASDGLQNGSEPGVAGVTVELFLNGTKIASTVTDAYGNYFFDNLATGGGNIYTVKVTPPPNYSFTTQTNASADLGNDATGSDINPLTSTSYNITLTAGETERDIDAGLIFNPVTTLLSIGDKVWYDNGQGGGTANDGIQNGTEPGVSGVTVTLYRDINGDGDVDDANEIIGTTVTDANGNYLFNNLPPNTNDYKVGFSLPPTFTFSPKDAGGDDATDSDVNTAAGANFGKTDFFNLVTANITTVDAGINNSTATTTASVGDRVWNDVDRDGIQDPDEPGLEGVLVTLRLNGTPVATTRTDAFGRFEFTNLAPGTGNAYEVIVSGPTGYTATNQDVGTNNSVDSDVSTATGSSGTFTLVAGQRKDIDAGFYNGAANLNSIGNFVWNDLDGDGVQDANEPGVPGVSVLIRTSAGAQVDNPYRAGAQDYVVTTDANGFYRFTDLPNGNYVLFFTNLPAGYTVTTPIGAGDNGTNTNSDATAASGSTGIYNLAGGEYDQTVDCGIVRGSAAGGPSLGNRVWYDLDNDGIQDAPAAGVTPELGVAGVTVTLNSPGPNGIIGDGDDVTGISTTTTDALGNYLFTSGNVPGGLLPGIAYYLRFTALPGGYSFSTPQNAGANDEADSDIANTGTGTTAIYVLGPTEENLTVDAGINNPSATLGSISNLVFFDVDGDGVQDAGEPGVQGVTVRLFNDGPDGIPGNGDDVAVGTTTTDVNGNYLFDGLAADNYTVYFSNYPVGFGGTVKDAGGDDNLDSDAPGTGKTDGITLAAGQDRTDVDFGIRSTTTAALGNFVWFDSNNDGVQDAGEPGIAGVTVLLYRPGFGPDGIAGNADDALPVASAITDANGGYLFTNLVPGTYELEFTNTPGGTTFTQQNVPGDNGNNTNSDVNPATGRTSGFVLAAGEVDLTVDAGVRRQTTATVGNFVWLDLTPDGTRNPATEPGVPGILVTLINSGGQVVASAITSNDGSYLFTNVTPGTYTIQFSNLPAGSNFTTQNVGGAGADNNSNPNTGTGITLSFTVPAGGADITIDAGLIGIPLPADGLSLVATLAGGRVQLNWKTISESNTSYFEIERSFDNAQFTKLGSNIAAAGTSSFERNYNGIDDLAGVQGTIIYYRIKLYDQNGAYKYSNVAVVRLKGSGIKVWPNPFADVLQVNITVQNNTAVELRLSDASGKLVIVQRQNVVKGTSQLSLNGLSRLSNGTYTLQVVNISDNSSTIYKLNKQH